MSAFLLAASLLCSTPQPVVAPGPMAAVELVARKQAQPAPEADDQEENPWMQALMAPMGLPWFWNALLDGWAPWGRAAWVKNLTAFGTLGLGVTMFAIFPCTLAFSVFMLVGAVLAAFFAVYAFFSGMMSGGCLPTGGNFKRGGGACGSIMDVWQWAMCCSFAMCTPWFGFKLVQRGWLAFQDPVPDTVEDAPATSPTPQDEDAPASGTITSTGARY